MLLLLLFLPPNQVLKAVILWREWESHFLLKAIINSPLQVHFVFDKNRQEACDKVVQKLGYPYNMNLSAVVYNFFCYVFSKNCLLYLKMAHCFLKYLVIILPSDKNLLQSMDLLFSIHTVPCTIKLFFLTGILIKYIVMQIFSTVLL